MPDALFSLHKKHICRTRSRTAPAVEMRISGAAHISGRFAAESYLRAIHYTYVPACVSAWMVTLSGCPARRHMPHATCGFKFQMFQLNKEAEEKRKSGRCNIQGLRSVKPLWGATAAEIPATFSGSSNVYCYDVWLMCRGTLSLLNNIQPGLIRLLHFTRRERVTRTWIFSGFTDFTMTSQLV